nr:sensory rhodopsin transducer [Cellulosimicrobium sp. MM]
MSAPDAPARRPRVGATCWAIGDGWIPPYGTGDDPPSQPREPVPAQRRPDDARRDPLYFATAPGRPYVVVVPAERVRHVTLNDLDDPEPVPRGTDYSAVVVASAPSSSSTRGSTRGRPPTPCSARSPTRRHLPRGPPMTQTSTPTTPAGARRERRDGPARPRALTPLVVASTVGAALGGFMFGFDTAVVNGAVDASRPSSASGARSSG